MSELPERNRWSIARHARDPTPDKTQRLLNHASWDTFAAMGVVRRFAVAGLEEAARRRRRRGLVIGAIDETGQEKAGEAGVKRQYLGCAGRVANGINTVHLSYVREKTGHALIGARQRIPREHLDDPVKTLLMGLPLDLAFRTKGQLAVDICADAYADGIGFDFACGDEVYSNCTQLREFFEANDQAYEAPPPVRADQPPPAEPGMIPAPCPNGPASCPRTLPRRHCRPRARSPAGCSALRPAEATGPLGGGMARSGCRGGRQGPRSARSY